MCTGILLNINTVLNSNNAFDFTTQIEITVPFSYTTFEGYYTMLGSTQYALNPSIINENIHLNEGILFNFNIKIDNCVYVGSVLLPSSLNCGEDYEYDLCYREITTELRGNLVIEGCTNPLSPNYNPNATVDDGSCLDPIEGCTNPLALNYNSNATVDDGSCILPVSGCTNPLSPNYNPNANVDDGSCLDPIYNYIAGCTNPLASNYNPNATVNNGSCIFITGCTDPYADNYNPNAAIDDGSCECNNLNLFLSLGQASGITLDVQEIEGECDFYLDFNVLLKLDCESFLNYYLNYNYDDKTIVELLNDLNLNIQLYTGETYQVTGDTITTTGDIFNYSGTNIETLSGNTELVLAEEKNIWNYDYNSDYTDLSIEGNKCDLFLEGLGLETDIDCYQDLESKFNTKWLNFQYKIDRKYANKIIQLAINFNNFKFKFCSLLDDIKFYKICEKIENECVLIPPTFGFEIEKIKDNKKSWIISEDNVNRLGDDFSYFEKNNHLIFNSKESIIRINVPNYIETDIIDYFNNNEQYLTNYSLLKNLNKDKLKEELIDVRNRLSTKRYEILHQTYDLYKNNINNYCSILSKQLDYEYIFDVYDKVNPFWYDLIKQGVPATTIWNNSTHYYSNNIIHSQKHNYKTYSIGKGDLTDAVLNCEILSENKCKSDNTYLSNVEEIYENNNICISGDTLGVGYINEGSYFTAKYVQYIPSGDTQTIIDQLDYPTVTTIDCISPPEPCDTIVSISSVTTTPTGTTMVGYETTVVFNTTGITDVNDLRVTVNDIEYTIDSFDVNEQVGVFTYKTALNLNNIKIESIIENCNNDIATNSFFHCEVGYEATIPIVDPDNSPFGRIITITIFANDVSSITVSINGATGTYVQTDENTYVFTIKYNDSGRPYFGLISILRNNCDNININI